MKRNKILLLTCLSVALISGASFADVDYYISPTGNDVSGSGSLSAPWRTVDKVRSEVRNKINELNDNINVVFLDGRYELKSTLVFDEKDSGSKNHIITYKAQNLGKAIISGGDIITGWSDGDGDGIWEASVAEGSFSRQLYVNGERAVRARSNDRSDWFRADISEGTYSASEQASTWKNKDDIEIITLYRWKMNRAPIRDISGTTAYVEPAHWRIAKIGPYGMQDSTAGHVSWVENAMELLDTKGEWYLNQKLNKLYYMPKEGEHLTGDNKVDVILPRLEKLISGKNVENIAFDGLQFSYATWLQPSDVKGYVSIQSGALLTDDNYTTIEDAFDGLQESMGNIEFKKSNNVVFKNNTFKHLGANALTFGDSSQNNIIFNNTFTDISSSAIVIGDLQKHHVDSEGAVKDNVIDNNLVYNVAVEFYDSVGVKVNYTTRTVISNNTIHNLPSGAISTGWGWGRYDVENFAFPSDNTGKAYNTATIAKDNVIYRNKIYDITKKIGDTGGIYNLGASLNSRILENFIYQVNKPMEGTKFANAVYLDNGTRGVEVSGNGSFDIADHGYFCNGCTAYNTIGENTLFGFNNGSESDISNDLMTNSGQQEILVSPRSVNDILAELPPKLTPVDLATPPSLGLLVGKVASASAGVNPNGAIDEDINTFWDMGKGNVSGWWKVDLVELGTINKIQFALGHWDSRLDSEIYLRKGVTFQLQKSKDGVNFDNMFFSTGGYGQAAISKTDTWTTTQSINDIFIDGSPTVRFIRLHIIDTDNQNLGLLRFKITGSIGKAVNGINIALQGTASQSSTYSESSADIAIDGDISGNWGLGQATHTDLGSQNYWDLDLGSVNDIELIRIWNRTDCCSARLRDFHVFVSEKPLKHNTVEETKEQIGVNSYPYEGMAGATTDIDINKQARYVRIQLNDNSITGDNVLSLAEVQVYKKPVIDPDANQYPAWDSATIYITETISHKGLVYQSKWWNQNSEPMLSNEAWRLMSDVGIDWDKNSIYLSGDTTIHLNAKWTAQWWTKGDEPGKDDVWMKLN